MATKKDSASVKESEENARLFVRTVLKTHLLSYDAAIEWERNQQRLQNEMLGLKDIAALWVAEEELADFRENPPPNLDEFLRTKCAEQIENKLPPSPLRDYTLHVLRKPSQRTLQRKGKNDRDFAIYFAVNVAIWKGLRRTRNSAQRHKGGPHSACSLVAEELKEFGIELKEDGVLKVCEDQKKPAQKFSDMMRLAETLEK
jgi:hypothetical protein